MKDEEFLAALCSEDANPDTMVANHFESMDIGDWCDASREGLRLTAVVVDQFYEKGGAGECSAFDIILTHVAAEAANSVFKAFSKATGLDAFAMSCVLEAWQGKRSAEENGCIGWKALGEMIRAEMEWQKMGPLESEADPNTTASS